jgi:BirA family biotin operon repressor/biotin-[acetyl-CoA-carboxylase] ligase
VIVVLADNAPALGERPLSITAPIRFVQTASHSRIAEMDEKRVAAVVDGLPLTKWAYLEQVGSTNDVAADWLAAGQASPALVVADEQTAGRGRQGRSWHTPPGSALALSLLLDANTAASHMGRAPGLGGLAVCSTLEALYGLQPQIKWPNDVLLDGKKVCGVLAEAQWSGNQAAALILGIGINVAARSVPPAKTLSFPATCVENALGRPVDRVELLGAVLRQTFTWLESIADEDFIAAWQRRLAYMHQPVTLAIGAAAPPLRATLRGLAADGSLLAELADGRQKTFAAGEITLRPAAN